MGENSPETFYDGNEFEEYEKAMRRIEKEELKEEEKDDDDNDDDDGDGDDGDDDDDDDDGDDYDDDDDGDDDEDQKSIASDAENDDTDPWDKLREEVVNDLSSTWEEQVKENTMQGLPQDVAEVQASNLLLPVYRKRLRRLYLHYLKWYRDLRTDPLHKKIMKTLHSFMQDDDMDYSEAAEAAVNTRKYLLNTD